MPELSSLGRHLIVELYDCQPDILNDVILVEKEMVAAAQKANATVINVAFHHFAPFGVSGVVVIQESHLTIHSWPEYGYAAIDLFTCGETVNPWVAFKHLEKAFRSKKTSSIELSRGQQDLLQSSGFDLGKLRQESTSQLPSNTFSKDIWFTDRASNIALSVKHHGDLLHREESAFQKIEVYQSNAFGKMLVLDGKIATTEYDESDYHEMMVHIPMLTHPKPKNILIIGGGDGGAVREVIKYQEVEKITLVEVDHQVIEISKKYLPSISEAMENKKLEIILEDGIQFAASNSSLYDIIIVDSSDPVSSGELLFDTTFYQNLQKQLSQNGILVSPTGSPNLNKEIFKSNYQFLKNTFGLSSVWCYMAFMPSYITGMWSFAYCSSNIHPLENIRIEQQESICSSHTLNYYNKSIHHAAFVLPNFVERLLSEKNT